MGNKIALPRRSIVHRPMAWAAMLWLTSVLLGAGLAPVLAPDGPMATAPSRALLPPGPGALLGTDFLGRDMWARLLWGARLTLAIGAVGMILAVGLGLPIGLVAGGIGGRIDDLLMRLIDGVLALPSLLLAMVLVAVLGVGIGSVAIAVGLAGAPSYARVTRSVVHGVRTQPFMEAAQVIGCSSWRIASHYLLPNSAPSLVAFAGTQLGWVLLNGAALTFLGLGASPGTPEWGILLAEGRGYLRDAPWASVLPGLALTLTVIAVNLVGDAWQDAQGGT